MHLRKEAIMLLRYHDARSVIIGLTEEWLECTTGAVPEEVPVFGWPLGNKLVVTFSGHIPAEDHETIKDVVFMHFDGARDEPIFPVADITVEVESDSTHVTLIGDTTRAGSMQQLRALLR